MNHSMDKVNQYYTDMRVLIDVITANNGFANLGWLPDGVRRSYHEAQQELVRYVTDQLMIKPGSRIVEVGCGIGGPGTETSLRLHSEVVGIELLRQQITTGLFANEGKGGQFKYLEASSMAIPLQDNCCDGVYSIESAFHYADKAKFIAEVSRILRKGGKFAVADVVLPQNYQDSWFEEQLSRSLSAPNFFTSEDYLTAAKNSGFSLKMTEDLSSGVARSVSFMSPLVFEKWGALREANYAIWYLLAIYLLGKSAPLIHRLLPSEYRLFVFEKQ